MYKFQYHLWHINLCNIFTCSAISFCSILGLDKVIQNRWILFGEPCYESSSTRACRLVIFHFLFLSHKVITSWCWQQGSPATMTMHALYIRITTFLIIYAFSRKVDSIHRWYQVYMKLHRHMIPFDQYVFLKWRSWCLELPVNQVFVQQFVQIGYKETSKVCFTVPLWGNRPVTGGSPHKGTVTRKCFHLMTS